MKRIFTTMAIAIALLTATGTQAQGIKFGVKGGFNITSMSFDKSEAKSVVSKDNRNGWFFGPTVKVSLLAGLGLDGALLYDQRSTKLDSEETVKQQSINIPINLRYSLGLGSLVGVYAAAGPQFGFNIGDSKFNWTSTNSYTNTFQLKKSQFSINLGVGAYVLKRFEVGLVYNIPVGNTADLDYNINSMVGAVKGATDVKSHTWQISAAVYL